MKFFVHFFKEKTRKIDVEALFEFFENYKNIKPYEKDNTIYFSFEDDNIKLYADFALTPKSIVSDIHRLDPKYLDINFHLEISPLLPTYKAEIIFEIIAELCEEFKIFIYNELFDNVLPFRKELLVTVYEIIKKAFKEKSLDEYEKMYYMEKDYLNQILKYQYIIESIKTYLKNDDITVPNYLFFKPLNGNTVKTAIEWIHGVNTVFPPKLDYVIYKKDGKEMLYSFDEVNKAIAKHLSELPIFVKDTRISAKHSFKKILKIMNKNKFRELEDNFIRIDIEDIIDI